MTPKSGDNPLRKHQQSTEKEERNEGDSDNFLRSESDNSLLLQFWLFQQGSKKLFSVIAKHYLLFFWSNNNLSRHCVHLP